MGVFSMWHKMTILFIYSNAAFHAFHEMGRCCTGHAQVDFLHLSCLSFRARDAISCLLCGGMSDMKNALSYLLH
jgi:hypothetical protein